MCGNLLTISDVKNLGCDHKRGLELSSVVVLICDVVFAWLSIWWFVVLFDIVIELTSFDVLSGLSWFILVVCSDVVDEIGVIPIPIVKHL